MAADAAIPWQLHRGEGCVRLNLHGSGRSSLASRMCRPHLASFKPLPLYEFQRAGVARLLRSRRLMLADDMGLGKTIQVAGAMRSLLACGRIRNALVVSPATLLQNWLQELRKWTPELVVILGGPNRQVRNRGWQELMDHCHVIVTSYEDIRDGMDSRNAWKVDLLVVDEAHRLKNWNSKTTKGARLVQAQWIWALTGTPLERDSEDLANLLAFLDRDAFTSGDASLPVGVLRSRAGRFVLRREKSEVLKELPTVVPKHEYLVMGEMQAMAYRRASSSRPDENPLAKFTRLRTICDYDPKTGESSKVDRIVTIVREVAAAGEKAVVFSYILEPLWLIESCLSLCGITSERLVGSMDSTERRDAIDRFRHGKSDVLLASMRIGSEGLTLVEANHAVFVNRWWNPSLNEQAKDRVVRIGQHRTVFVYTFTSTNTIEEDLDRILARKSELFDKLVRQLSVGGSDLQQCLDEMKSE